jgi:hypothetical protein
MSLFQTPFERHLIVEVMSMSSLFRAIRSAHRHLRVTQPSVSVPWTHVVWVPRSDRWRIYHRLQELQINCWCLPDGSLQVVIPNGLTAVLLWSVVQQFIAARPDNVDWLERCWQAKLSNPHS